MNRYKFAELYDRNGDLSKRWFVGFYYENPETGKFQLFQIYISSKLLTKHARRVKSNQIIDDIDNKLKQGYNGSSGKVVGEKNNLLN